MVCIKDPNNPSREELVAFFNSEEVQRGVLDFAHKSSREAGMEVSFEGVYKQGFLTNPRLMNLMPFVIAQTTESRDLNSEGFLEGVIFEFMKYALIRNGQIDTKRISFIKQYEPNPIVPVNPNPIFYEGSSDADGVYRGTWRFSSDVGDLARQGSFELIKIE